MYEKGEVKNKEGKEKKKEVNEMLLYERNSFLFLQLQTFNKVNVKIEI